MKTKMDREKETPRRFQIWKASLQFQRNGPRKWYTFGLLFILLSGLTIIIYQTLLIYFSNQFFTFTTHIDEVYLCGPTIRVQQRICPNNLSIVKDAPSSLQCGMTVNVIGRLGNLMGEYATLLALSEMNNKPAVLLPQMSDILRLYFKISLPTIEPDELTFWKHRWKDILLNDWMEPRLRNLNDPFNYLLGYPNSWTFYHHIKARILQEFQFHDHIQARTHLILNQFRKGRDSVTFVGVHNRRGDYVRLMDNDYRGVVADAKFFRKAFDYFESKYPDAVFLVVSDDMEWCVENINNSRGNIYFVGNNNEEMPVYDLALMANCNHSIITIGTFGYWGAYLAGGETVYLSNYLMPDSTFLQVFKYEAFYLPEWIPIDANLSSAKRD